VPLEHQEHDGQRDRHDERRGQLSGYWFPEPSWPLTSEPVAPSPIAGLAVEGPRLLRRPLEIEVDAAGDVVRAVTDAPVRIEVAPWGNDAAGT
jgi:hypothetical protein